MPVLDPDGPDEDVWFAEAAYRWRIPAGLSILLLVFLCKLTRLLVTSIRSNPLQIARVKLLKSFPSVNKEDNCQEQP